MSRILISLLIAGIFLLSAHYAKADNAVLEIYTNKDFGIEFSYLSNVIHEPCNEAYGTDHCVGFKKKNAKDYDFTLEVRNSYLDDTIASDGCFEKKNNDWVTGQCGPGIPGQSTTIIKANGWVGIYGVRDCEIMDDNGFHAAGLCLTAFLSQDGKTAIFNTLGTIDPQEFLKKTVYSFKFLK